MYQLIFIITVVIVCITLTIKYEKHKEITRHIYYGRLFSRIKSVTQEIDMSKSRDPGQSLYT